MTRKATGGRPSGRRAGLPELALERAGEMALVVEAGLLRDLRDALAGGRELPGGPVEPQPPDVGADRRSVMQPEDPGACRR